jgi:hypothetical protein
MEFVQPQREYKVKHLDMGGGVKWPRESGVVWTVTNFLCFQNFFDVTFVIRRKKKKTK